MNPTSITLTLSLDEISKLKDLYSKDMRSRSDNPYIEFYAALPKCTIAVYSNMKNNAKKKVVFQGLDAVKEAKKFGYVEENEPMNFTMSPTRKPFYRFANQIGSDEVGTGDFFGPVIVCAAYVDEAGLKKLEALGVTDSKKMNDDYIRAIGADLSREFDHSLLILRNEKYNEVNASGLNMNAIKAKMHNQCLYNVSSRHPQAKIYQDQFAEEGLYYRYLKGEAHVVSNIVFATKGESKFPSVALASVIARYAFLIEMDRLGERLGEKIPFGAGKDVDAFAKRIAKEKGLPFLRKAVKANFVNFEKIASSM